MAILRAAATRGAAQDTTAWLGDVRRANHEYGLVDRPFALRSVQNIAPLGGGVGTRLPRPSTSHSNTSNDQVLRSPLELRGGAPVQTVHGVAANVGGVRLLPDLRHRRRPAALARGMAAPADGAGGVADPRVDPPAVRGAAHRGPGVDDHQRLRPDRHARPPRPAHLRSLRRRHRRRRRGARPPRPAGGRQGQQGRPRAAAAGRQAGDRARHRRTRVRAGAAEPAGRPDEPARRHPPTPAPGRRRRRATPPNAPAHAPPHLRHHHARRRGRPPRRSRSPHATPTPELRCATTGLATTSTATPTTSSPPTWPPARDRTSGPGAFSGRAYGETLGRQLLGDRVVPCARSSFLICARLYSLKRCVTLASWARRAARCRRSVVSR